MDSDGSRKWLKGGGGTIVEYLVHLSLKGKSSYAKWSRVQNPLLKPF